MAKYTAIGGQALIEGIMIRSPEKTAMAVRKPDKDIDISYIEEKSLRKRFAFFRIPVIRGIVGFIESMKTGYGAMMKSAEISGFTDLDDEEDRKEDRSADSGESSDTPETSEASDKPKKDEKMSEKTKKTIVSVTMVVGTVLGVVASVVLFMWLPRLVVGGMQKLFSVEYSKIVRSSIEQLIKLAVFVGYMAAVSLMKDMRRVFMYHGAEHKTIFCYEKGLPLTVENVRIQKRFHPRCGTSFMILMIIVSIIFSTIVQMIFPGVYDISYLWVIAKILLIPIICGVGFEILRICGKYDNIFTRIVSAPGLWMQRITTKEPQDDMIEIAIAALRAREPETPDVDRSVDEQSDTDGDNLQNDDI
ncbi:MAG: DUF1385 domain-containing protein [Clostridia bacterium]|nr:DUF1385 domain-containing protein [Clostridia bacterium]